MSYCVNCGVELDDSASKCVLCNTPVINPNIESPIEAPKPFSEIAINPASVKSKFVAAIISVVLLIPNVVCFFINVLMYDDSFWTVYVNATSMLLWVLFVFPFLQKKLRPILMWAFNTLSVAFYIYAFYALEATADHWYFQLALPCVATVSLCVFIFILWIRKKGRHWSSILIHIFADTTVISLVFGCLFAEYFSSVLALGIGIILAISSIGLVGFFIYCNTSKRVRALLERKFFV